MSGLAYSPPLYYFNGIDYNEAFFVNQNGSTLSKAYLDSTYLLRVGVANSTATITNFSGLVSISQLLTASGGLQVTNGLTCNAGTATTFFSAPTINGTSVSLYSNFINLSVTNLSVTTLTLSDLTLSTLTATGTINALNITVNNNANIVGSLTVPTIINSFINSGSNLFLISSGGTILQTATTTNTGLEIGWNNRANGVGETDYINCSSVGAGGHNFYNANSLTVPTYLGGISSVGFTSVGIITGTSFQATNSSLTSNFYAVQTGNVNVSGFTTFNVNHPTTSLGNNISTNTTQYATVGYVNSNSAGTLLTANNTWTGTNSFTQNTISIGSGLLSFGRASGNAQSIIIGDSSSLAAVNASAVYNISIGTQSMYLTTAQQCCSFGNFNLSALTTGNTNHVYGSSSGQAITTGTNNIICGINSWNTGNFSNCAVFGINAPSPFTNNSVIIGSASDTVYVAGSSQLNNTLLNGTTVVSNNLQVNGNIIQPILTFTAGVSTTFTSIPPFVLFIPAAGMGFIWPAPSALNTGQTFTIRRTASGGGQTINNTIVGNLVSWWTTSASAPIANIAISTLWSFTFVSNGSGYYQIA